jgi:hypothetical protein
MNAGWTIPQIWEGETCYIIGGGPSVKTAELSLLRGRRTIAVNNAYQLGDWDILFYGDCRWRELHANKLADWPGLKIHACNHGTERIGDTKRVERRNLQGLSRNPEILAWNLSSGACAVNLATLLGVKKIVLIGFDMRKIDGQNNWHVDHPTSNRKGYDPYKRFLGPFPKIAEDLVKLQVECINATPGSALTLFPIMTLPEAVC